MLTATENAARTAMTRPVMITGTIMVTGTGKVMGTSMITGMGKVIGMSMVTGMGPGASSWRMNRNTDSPTDASRHPPILPAPVRLPGPLQAAALTRVKVLHARQRTRQKQGSAGNMTTFMQTAMEGAATPQEGGDRDRWQKKGRREV